MWEIRGKTWECKYMERVRTNRYGNRNLHNQNWRYECQRQKRHDRERLSVEQYTTVTCQTLTIGKTRLSLSFSCPRRLSTGWTSWLFWNWNCWATQDQYSMGINLQEILNCRSTKNLLLLITCAYRHFKPKRWSDLSAQVHQHLPPSVSEIMRMFLIAGNQFHYWRRAELRISCHVHISAGDHCQFCSIPKPPKVIGVYGPHPQ